MAELNVLHSRFNNSISKITQPIHNWSELWETYGIPAVFTYHDPITTPWYVDVVSWGNMGAIAELDASDNPNLTFTAVYFIDPSEMYNNRLIKASNFEFEAKIGTVANSDDTKNLMGFLGVAGSSRLGNDLIGIGHDAVGNVQTITKDGGAETAVTHTGTLISDVHLYKIRVIRGSVQFWIDGILAATHTTNLPSTAGVFGVFWFTTAGGSSVNELGPMRVWFEDGVY